MLGISEGKILSQEEKSRPDYGLRAVQQMYGTFTNSAIGIGYNSIDYIKNMDLALGRPSQFIDNVARFLGYRQNDMLSNQGINSIDPQIVNLAPKFINHVHGKLMNFQYEVGVDVIDATSIDEKKQLKAELEAYVKLKDFFSGVGVQFEQIKKESGIEELPDTMEDVQLIMTNTYKHYEAMRAELELKKVHNMNDWESIKSKFIWELLVQGQAGVRTYLDEKGNIREEWFPMNRFLCSYSESEDFDKLSHAGFIDYITVDQFFGEARDTLTEEEMFDLIKTYATTNFAMNSETPSFILPQQGTGNVKYMRIMRFQFIEEDVENYVQFKDKDGNVVISKKKAGFKIAPEERIKYETGEKVHIQASTKTKYGGTWIVGTNKVYDYGIIQQGDDVRVDYHVFAPNMRNGRVTSLVAQIREPLEMISVAWTRFKDIMGKGYNGKLELNLDLLADLSLGKGGTAPNWKHALDLFTINDIVLAKGKRNIHDQNVGSAVSILNQGLGAQDFVNAIELGISMIQNICGVNPLTVGDSPKAGTLNGVFEMSNDATTTNLQYLFRAYNSVYKRASLAILGYWKQIPSNMAWEREYDVGVTAATTAQEWAAFYEGLARQIQTPLIDGGLKYSDYVRLRNVKNLKQAEFLAIKLCRDNMAKAQAMQQETMQLQAQQNQQAAQIANQAKMEQMQMEVQLFQAKESFLTQEIIKRQEKVNEGLMAGKQIEATTRQNIAETQSRTVVLKEAQRSNSDQKVQEMKNQLNAMKMEMEDRIRNFELELKQRELEYMKGENESEEEDED